MKCNWEWLSAYLDGALSEDKRAKLEEHLKTCEACSAKLEEFARVEPAAKKIPVPQLSEAYWENFAGRVQNKLTIREKQKTSPRWLEALKRFFQPTTGKLTIAGSLATILLVTIIGQDYWKKEAYQPPKFEAVAPPVNDKIDSVQEPAKDESAFRTARPDEKLVVAEKKRENKIASAKAAEKGIIESQENAPAALAPAEIASKPAGRQKTKEEPSLAGYLERDEAIQDDTLLVTAGKKAEIRKEVDTSQVKVGAEEIEKLSVRNAGGLLKAHADTTEKAPDGAPIGIAAQSAQEDTPAVTVGRQAEARKSFSVFRVQEIEKLPVYDSLHPPPIESLVQRGNLRYIISEKEKELKKETSKSKTESLYVLLGDSYTNLYRWSQKQRDWNKANRRINDFLNKELSDSTRQRLLQIQTELKKLKK